MTDGQRLFALFTFLYLVECLRLVPAGVRLLMAEGARGGLRRAFAPLDFAGRRLIVLPVLFPAPVFLLVAPWQFVPCEQGLELLDEHGAPDGLVPWPELKPVAEGKVLRLTEQRRVLFHHPVLAAAMAERLLQWSASTAEARERDFEKLARASLDTGAPIAHVQESANLTRRLRGLAAVIFLVCFGIIPVVYRWLGDSTEVLCAGGVLMALMWTQAVIFWRAVGRLPKGSVKHRFWKTLPMLLLPQFALRAADHLLEARPLPAHPLAAWTTLSEKERLKLARHFWNAARHPSAASADLQQRLLREFWRKHEFDEALLEEVPERQPGSAAYCPHCSAQFRDATMLCRDCGGVELRPFR